MFWRSQKVIEIKKELEFLNQEMSKVVCCFTGYRPDKMPWGYDEKDYRCLELKNQIEYVIEQTINDGYKIFLCGMALGFDTFCAEAVLKLKKRYKHIKLIGAIPCKDQDCNWKPEFKVRYRKLISQLDGIRCIYDTYNGYECMMERNYYMVNNSSKLIALYDGKSGGTKRTIEYAKKRGLNMTVLNP